jgi:hypothetical protein
VDWNSRKEISAIKIIDNLTKEEILEFEILLFCLEKNLGIDEGIENQGEGKVNSKFNGIKL